MGKVRLAIGLGLVLMVGIAGWAQSSAPADSKAQDTKAAGQETKAAETKSSPVDEVLQRRLDWFGQNLNVSDEQKEKLRPIVADQIKEIKAVAETVGMPAEQKRDMVKQIREKHLPDILAILTPEQKEKFNKMREAAISLQGGGPSKPADDSKAAKPDESKPKQ